MKVVGLISGGKDSSYNMMQCVAEGHEIIALANLRPKDKDELDSYMFQTVGHHTIDLYAQAMGLPLYRRTLQGGSLSIGADYTTTLNDEVEDLYELLKEVKEAEEIDAVSVGAILSDYQRVRVENVCSRLGLTPLAYLWQRDQTELLGEMVSTGVEAILIKVAALGLDPKRHLGKTLSQIYPHMLNMKEKFGLNVCGEGGEYETFTLDFPLFKHRIVIDEMETVLHSPCEFAPVAYLNIHKAHLEDKDAGGGSGEVPSSEPSGPPTKCGSDRLGDCFLQDVTPPLSRENEPCVKCTLQKLEGNHIKVQRSSSGHVWVTGVTGEVGTRDCIQAAVKQAMDLLKEKLKDEGLSMSDLIVIHMYVKDMSDFAKVNQVYKTFFSINPPARVCVQVAMPSNILLQLDCLGYGDSPLGVDTCVPLVRRTLHVQGLSHWAPANIGPYSQAVKLGDIVYVAGQIGMVPADLRVVPGLRSQCRLSLQHVTRILAVMETTLTICDIILGICYVTHADFVSHVEAEFSHCLKDSQVEEDFGSEEASSVLPPMMEYVVVPVLPKGALVEWQVYANVCRDKLDAEVRKCKGCLSAWLQCRLLPAPASLLSFLIRIDREDDSDVQIVARDMIELAVLTLEGARGQLSHKQENVGQCFRAVRIFYRQDVLDENQLQSDYSDLGGSHGDLPAPVFIPVISFRSPKQVMSWCS